MSDALNWVLLPLGLLLLAAASLLVFQGLASLLPNRRDAGDIALDEAARYVVLMPAHDEADIIEAAVKQTLLSIGGQGRLLVIADNCVDATATLARAAGAQVVERHHASERGKGFALAYGVAQLADDPPDVVVILDADCKAEAGAIDLLVAQAQSRLRPIQGRYDMLPPHGAGLKQRMAAFAWDFRSRIRAEGFRRVGLPCQLMGSGMAFPWSLMQRVSLA
ncbi:MAG: glycosyltransferase, partial [Comamonadaceae bacterium]